MMGVVNRRRRFLPSTTQNESQRPVYELWVANLRCVNMHLSQEFVAGGFASPF